MENFKPMRARTADLSNILFPAYVSTKVDGLRVNIIDGKARTKSLKPISNIYTRELLEKYPNFEGIEAELTTSWDYSDEEAFNKATGDFRRFEGEPNVCMSIFDLISNDPFTVRYNTLQRMADHFPSFARVLPQVLVNDMVQLQAYIENARQLGHEGIMIRYYGSRYKCGTATLKGQELMRYKFLEDDEAIVEGVEEGHINTNEKIKNELGRSSRSSSKDGLVPSGLVGAILGRHPQWGIVRVSGLKDDLAKDMLENIDKYIGKLFTFRYQAHGSLEAPRQAKFKGFRDPDDMSLP